MTTRTDLKTFAEDLAWGVALEGVAAHEAAVTDFAHLALQRGIVPAIAGVLADPNAPDVARQRAFGRVARALVAHDDRASELPRLLAQVA